MWIPRIETPGALRGVSEPARTFETIGGSILDPIDIGEIVDAHLAMAMNTENCAHMPGF